MKAKIFVVISILVLTVWLYPRVGTKSASDNRQTQKSTPIASSEKPTLIGEMDLATSALPCDGSGCRLNVSVAASKVCYRADMDTINAELSLSKKKQLLLSLEPVTGSDPTFPPQTKSVTDVDLTKGFEHTFSWKVEDKPIQLGLFLCKDSSGQGRCNTKIFMPTMEIGLENGARRKEAGFEPSDKVYYFQYLLVDKQSVFSIPDLTKLDNSVNTSFKRAKYITDRTPGAELSATQRSVTENITKMMVLRSVPFTFSNGVGKIDIPKYDKTSCAKN